MTITIILPDGSGVPKRNYPLYISFTQPGEYIFDTGYTLRVYDICDDSTFPEAPTFSPNDDDYWIGFDQDLVLDVSWVKDTAFESSGINCGPYIIDAVYDSPVSIMIGDPIDDTQFTI